MARIFIVGPLEKQALTKLSSSTSLSLPTTGLE